MSAGERRGLLIGYGNPGRLDDGLGPALAERMQEKGIAGLDVDADYQLVVEDAQDVAEHDFVIFADASVSGPEPFSFGEIEPGGDTTGYSTHSVEPPEVLGLARRMFGAATRGYVLAIRGYVFDDFGETLSDKARANLDAAVAFIEGEIQDKLRR